MKEVFIVSKNTSITNYLFLLLAEICPNTLRLGLDFSDEIDLLIIDSETISPKEVEAYRIDVPILLFTYKIRPFLIQYTTSYDINGVVSLEMEAEDLLKTIQSALNKDIYYNEKMISILFSNKFNNIAKKVTALTDRENEILLLMMSDLTNEEIAKKLNLSVRTINAHKGNIMRKVGSKTTSGLIQALLDYSPDFRNKL